MAIKYTKGIVSPKGFNMSTAEPVDQRTIVEYKSNLLNLQKVYPGLKVQVLESLEGKILREFKFMGGDSSTYDNWEEVTGGSSSSGESSPDDLPLKFTSFVFKRNIGQPATPVGGSYADPVPPGWDDMVPAGTDPVWYSSGVLTQGSTDLPAWNEPLLAEDSATIDFEFCKLSDVPPSDLELDGSPKPPLQEPNLRAYWHNDATTEDNWMAIGTKVGGAYPTYWDIVKIGGEKGDPGNQGEDGRAYVPSTVFTRTSTLEMDNAIVTGGSFSNPYPSDTTINGFPVSVVWSDGVPMGTEKVWMTSFIFNDVDNTSEDPNNLWVTPGPITDSATDDFEFSDSIAQPPTPDVDASYWSDVATVNTIWMAHRSIDNGIFSAWTVTKIKGETGDTGKGLDIQGRDTACNIINNSTGSANMYDVWLVSGDATIAEIEACSGITMDQDAFTNDAFLFVGAGNGEGGSAWDNIGSITGSDGISFKQSFVFLRSDSVPPTPSGGNFDNPIPDGGWEDGIPTGTTTLWTTNRFFAQPDPGNLVDWKAPTLGRDTVDFDIEYAGKQTNDPIVPPPPPGGIWHDVPEIEDYWRAIATKVNGVTDNTSWKIDRIKGEKGEDGQDGVPSFLSSAYLKTNTDISGVAVTGGSYSDPVPTSTADGKNWTDGVPPGEGALWFVQVKFSQTDTGIKAWPYPTMIIDSDTIEYQFSSSIDKPTGYPVEGNPGGNSWYDDAEGPNGPPGKAIWMAIGTKRNKEWPLHWDIIHMEGEKGDTGASARTYIPSTRFCRSDSAGMDQQDVVGQYLIETDGVFGITGGDPEQATGTGPAGYKYKFSDGIPPLTEDFPNNAKRVWMIQHVFNSVDDLGVDNIVNWGPATLLQDSAGMDFQYHRGVNPPAGGAGSRPDDPVGPAGSNPDAKGWYDLPELVPGGAYWIGQKNWSDGPAAQWAVYQIRGEDGEGGSAPVVTPPSIPSNLIVYRDGFNERAEWSAATADPSTSIDFYEIEETQQGLGTFTSTTFSVAIIGMDGEFGLSYSLKIRAVDKLGNKGDWSVGISYTPPRNNIYGYPVQIVNSCGDHSPAPYADAWLLIEDGRDLDTGGYAYTDKVRTSPYPAGTYAVYGYQAGDDYKKWLEFKVLTGGTCMVLGECL